MADMMYGNSAVATGTSSVGGLVNTGGGGDMAEENAGDYYSNNNYAVGPVGTNSYHNSQPRQRHPGLYVGNLTWWTTDRDVIEAINSVGVQDIQEVKFFENRNNGQSKGFCVVTFASEASLPIVLEKLPKIDLHNQNPVVTPYNRQNLNLFESQTSKPQRPMGGQMNSTNGSGGPQHAAGVMGINSITGVHAAAAAAATAGQMSQFGGGLQGAGGFNNHAGPRPPYQMRMRGPRSMMRGPPPGGMNNMMPSGPRMPRYMQPQWQNSQGGNSYNPRMTQSNISEASNRLSGGLKDDQVPSDLQSGISHERSYYATHHSSSSSSHHHHHHQSDHFRGSGEHSTSRDLHVTSDSRGSRDARDERDSSSRRGESGHDRSSRTDDRSSLRHTEDRSRGSDERHSSRQDDRSDRGSRRVDSSKTSSSRRADADSDSRTGRRDRDSDRSSKRDDRSSRKDRNGRERSDVEKRSRSRSRDKDKSSRRDRDRRERY